MRISHAKSSVAAPGIPDNSPGCLSARPTKLTPDLEMEGYSFSILSNITSNMLLLPEAPHQFFSDNAGGAKARPRISRPLKLHFSGKQDTNTIP